MSETTFTDVRGRLKGFSNEQHVFQVYLLDGKEILAYRIAKSGYIPRVRLSMKRFNLIRPKLEFLLQNDGYNFYRLKQ